MYWYDTVAHIKQLLLITAHTLYTLYLHEIIYTGYNVFTIKAFVLGTIYTCIKKNYIVCC